ncbi:MAG: DUF4401 domain-containing protein [Burkholderiales bacterium]
MNMPDKSAPNPSARPWYIGLLLGASGWLAGGFLLVFVAMLFHPDSAPGAAFSGVVLLAAAWGLFRADRDGAFTSQLALALSFAGQCLVLFAMVEHTHALAAVAGAAFVLQAVMLGLMPNRLHRLISALFALIAWALMWRFGLFGEPSWSATNANAPSLAAALTGWLITWLPVGAAAWWLIRHEPVWIARGWAPVLRPALSGLIVGIAFATLISYPLESFRWWGSAPARTDWLALWPLLSAGAALAAVAAAFALGSRALMGGSIVAVLLHMSHFYYALGTSLLLKSLLMLLMGAALLFAARRLAAKPEGATP